MNHFEEFNSKEERKSVCKLRLVYGLPCRRCKYSDDCEKYAKSKAGEKNDKETA